MAEIQAFSDSLIYQVSSKKCWTSDSRGCQPKPISLQAKRYENTYVWKLHRSKWSIEIITIYVLIITVVQRLHKSGNTSK